MITTTNKILIMDMIAIRKKNHIFYRIGSPPFCIFSYSFGKQHLFISETIKKGNQAANEITSIFQSGSN